MQAGDRNTIESEFAQILSHTTAEIEQTFLSIIIAGIVWGLGVFEPFEDGRVLRVSH